MARESSYAEIKDKLDEAIYNGLMHLGQDVQSMMYNNLLDAPSVDTGRLIDSIAYRTDKMPSPVMAGGSAQEVDKISKPETTYTVKVGTACPYAPFIEHGSGPHSGESVGAENTGSFDERIREWAARHGITEERDIYWLKKKIAQRGVKANPFLAPTEAQMQGGRASAYVQKEIDRVLKGIIKGKVTIEVTMGM